MATLIDASGAVLGRLASHVAKRLLEGEEVVLLNAEKALVSGSRKAILAEWRQRRARGTQRFGPYYPRAPHLIVKRTVRGMLPYQSPRGRAAFKRLRVELGVPAQHAGKQALRVPEALKPVARGMTVGQLSKELGARFKAPEASV